ncbi:C40 family peptidase [Velocimicrobium porci]|uniref:SH3 domain-containing protein n=1 Tax=Velocimicrobium porci TaxID=2606634 RepID=A0A6L5XZZ5_9FIRM|nr:NlpC/P60 family protein [Velocimicrobium porci]MSS64365.1 SH3 domain-containing protein [Velocimicrobium porci]
MNKHIVRFIALGLVGTALVSNNVCSASTANVLNSMEVAGITLSLNNYVEENVKNTQTKKASSKQKAEKKEEEEFKLNLVYDRLGVAKVNNYLNVRKKPNESSKIVGKLTKNAGCNVYKIKNGWAKIVSGKVKGWVSADYLVTDKEAEEYAKKVATKQATVNTETLKVRALPSTDSIVSTLVPMDEELDVVKENLTEEYVKNYIKKQDDKSIKKGVNMNEMLDNLDNWICVKVDDEKLFISKDYVDISFKLERAVKAEEVKEDKENGITSVRASMVEFAKQYLGNSYVYGGTSLTNGIDCSGFTMRIYQHFGYSIPRTSGAQAQASATINSSEAKPGDLFFYGNNGHVSHVAMYIGNGLVIHASNRRTGIKISNAFYRTPIKVGRFVNN